MADYTRLSTKEIKHLLEQYDLGPLEAAVPLSGGQANSSYRLTTAGGLFTLSVCDEKAPDEVATLTRILAYLKDHNFPTTRLVQPSNGNNFIYHGKKPVYTKEYLEGAVVRNLNRPMLMQVGSAMAGLHALPAPKGIPRAFPYGLSRFDEVLTANIDHPFKTWLKDKTAYLKSRLDLNMPKGFIHGDIFWDNLLFDNGTLKAVLDFEEACHYFFLYDLGMAAVGCCAADGRFDQEKLAWLMEGYQAVRPLTESDKVQFIPFLVYAATAAAFWRFRQYNLRRPDPGLADSYEELAALADQAPEMAVMIPGI